MNDAAATLTSTLIFPHWAAPPRVRAATTTRQGGVSQPPCESFNLGFSARDDEQAVRENRRRLHAALQLPADPAWIRQVHGNGVVDAATVSPGNHPEADASVSHSPEAVCVVMTADCLPVLLCDRAGTVVAAAHAGWRGLVAGILPATVAAMERPGQQLLAWLGPAISGAVYEVGDEVRAAFIDLNPANEVHFCPSPAGRWLADLYGIAAHQLADLGITAVHGGEYCTLSDPTRFYSYRRDGSSGRMASLIWLAP